MGNCHLIIVILKKKMLVPMSAKDLQDELSFQRLNEESSLQISFSKFHLMLFIREEQQQERLFWNDL